jgi:hypothetical protein
MIVTGWKLFHFEKQTPQTAADAYVKEEIDMSNKSTKSALNRFKYEVASELGVPLKDGYNGDLTSKQNGSVGGYMVKKMIEAQEKQMAGK